MVNSDPSFVEQPAVINGFSDLIVEVCGERGRHARVSDGLLSCAMEVAVPTVGLVREIESSRQQFLLMWHGAPRPDLATRFRPPYHQSPALLVQGVRDDG